MVYSFKIPKVKKPEKIEKDLKLIENVGKKRGWSRWKIFLLQQEMYNKRKLGK